MTEAFLHYIWQYQMLDGGLTTTDGQPVVVLKAGELNKDAGPDFFNARVRIGQVEWAGNVEVHIRTTDWHCHRHDMDAAYNNRPDIREYVAGIVNTYHPANPPITIVKDGRYAPLGDEMKAQ